MRRLLNKIESLLPQNEKQHKLLHLALLALFYFILEYEYYFFVFPGFSHLGYSFSFVSGKYLLSKALLAAGLIFLLKVKTSRFIYMVQITFFFMMLIPALVMFEFHEMNAGYAVSVLSFIMLLSVPISFNWLTGRIPAVNSKYFLFVLCILILVIIVPYMIIYGFNFSSQVFSSDLESHYVARSLAASKSNMFINYSFSPLAKVLLPALLIFGIIKKRYVAVAASVLLMSYLFMTNPHKTIIVTVFAMLLFTMFSDYFKKAGFIITGVIAAILLFKIVSMTVTIMPESLLVRRVLMTPALLSDFYFDLFYQRPVMLSHSIFSSFIDYPYPWEPSFLVGKIFYGNEAANCNANFIADGYMNFGYAGVGIFIVLTFLIFRYIDSLNLSGLWYGLVFIFIFQLSNGALLTNMLTHGGIVMLIVLTLFLKNKPEPVKNG